ncbi:MAG: hypothetical protein J7502_14400 [Flavisolibacter sp.]|nr:hypothetical protein [Flavisolibacter sp.]
MSYDLFFYKQKGSPLIGQAIRDYLAENLTKPNEQNTQWWFDNEDTGVYFCFETTDEGDFENYNELFEGFDGFENVRFMFNINFIRPDFFGQDAFLFVEKFIKDLDLYVLNPQSENSPGNPSKPGVNELYKNWAAINNASTAESFGKDDCYYPLVECNEIWRHNYNKWNLQAQYNEVYYVPKVYLIKEYNTNRIVTQTSWVEKATKLFNTLKFDIKDGELGEVVSWDKVYNSKP